MHLLISVGKFSFEFEGGLRTFFANVTGVGEFYRDERGLVLDPPATSTLASRLTARTYTPW